MCVVSMIGDHYSDKFRDDWYKRFIPWTPPIPNNPYPWSGNSTTTSVPSATKEEFDALKKEVEEMKKLLIRAKIYDEKNNEPDCEIDAKIELLKKFAEIVGIDLSDIFKKIT
jgi:ABC-type phosphate/phosphonate transport system substrate-binding protein